MRHRNPLPSPCHVQLVDLDEGNLRALLAAAVAGAEPADVMPPVPGEVGWTDAQREGFVAFHRRRSLDPLTSTDQTFVVLWAGDVVGAGRLEWSGGAAEIGIWLTRPARGRGLGAHVARQLRDLAVATGAGHVVAHTTADNEASLALLAALGARLTRRGDAVEAVLP